MGKMIFFTVKGVPIAKGRPRFARRGNFVSTYTPRNTANYADLVKSVATISMQGQQPLLGALKCKIEVYFPIPKSATKKVRAGMLENSIKHTKKPDADNAAKNILDACNGICYRDDVQIYDLHVIKYYSDYPMVEIEIEED